MTIQLNRIIADAEEIANTTSLATDLILDACDALKDSRPGDQVVSDVIVKIYQACGVQDLTNQRIKRMLRNAARLADPDLADDDELLAGPQNTSSGTDDAINRLLDKTE